ncbi:unnamed protein product [Diamesa hyperborea]
MENKETRRNCLVLKEKQWKDLKQRVAQTDEEKAEEKSDDKLLEYLKKESAAMKKKWPELNVKPQQKVVIVESDKPEVNRYKAIQIADAQKRKELIEQAENFVNCRKIKEGPIELNSAAILSQALKTRALQTEYKKQFLKDDKVKNELKNKEHILQSNKWIEDYDNKRTAVYLNARTHKKELCEMIQDRKNKKDKDKELLLAQERKNIDQHFKNGDDQKRLLILQKQHKRNYMRQNEIEATRISKQKSERLKEIDNVMDILVRELNEAQRQEREDNKKYIIHDTSDEKFFKYADELLLDAEKKGRPTLPIIKTLSAYKKRHFLDIKFQELPHVISNVPIGENWQLQSENIQRKSKARIKQENDDLRLVNPYRTTKFLKNTYFD